MENIFEEIKVYGKWQVIVDRPFNAAEIAKIDSCEVVASKKEEYNTISICFHFKGGGKGYLPLTFDSCLSLGDKPDPKKLRFIKLASGVKGEAHYQECRKVCEIFEDEGENFDESIFNSI